jgi:hypothetical protein
MYACMYVQDLLFMFVCYVHVCMCISVFLCVPSVQTYFEFFGASDLLFYLLFACMCSLMNNGESDGTSKMSKSAESDGSRINLLDSPDLIVKKVSCYVLIISMRSSVELLASTFTFF